MSEIGFDDVRVTTYLREERGSMREGEREGGRGEVTNI